jgi:hypothetical protein
MRYEERRGTLLVSITVASRCLASFDICFVPTQVIVFWSVVENLVVGITLKHAAVRWFEMSHYLLGVILWLRFVFYNVLDGLVAGTITGLQSPARGAFPSCYEEWVTVVRRSGFRCLMEVNATFF